MAITGSTKAVLAALLANCGMAVAKFVAFIFTGASSMLAESLHSMADTSNQALLLMGGRLAKRRATVEHPFGYGRERYFWAFVVALVLFSVGSLYSVYEGINKIRDPHPIETPVWAFGVLAVGLLLEGLSLRTAVTESNRVRGSVSWVRFVRRSRTPELPIVLFEDLGAITGLMLAMGTLSVAVIFEAPVWDGIGTLAIGTLLGLIAVVLAVEMRSLLLGEAATPDNVDAIREAIHTTEGVVGLVHLRTQHFGPEELLVAANVAFEEKYSIPELAEAITRVETNTKKSVPIAVHIYIEPDLMRAVQQDQKLVLAPGEAR